MYDLRGPKALGEKLRSQPPAAQTIGGQDSTCRFLCQPPDQRQSLPTFARSDDTPLFECLDRVLGCRSGTNHFAVFQPTQQRIASEQICLQLVAVLNVRNEIQFSFRQFWQYVTGFLLRHRFSDDRTAVLLLMGTYADERIVEKKGQHGGTLSTVLLGRAIVGGKRRVRRLRSDWRKMFVVLGIAAEGIDHELASGDS